MNCPLPDVAQHCLTLSLLPIQLIHISSTADDTLQHIRVTALSASLLIMSLTMSKLTDEPPSSYTRIAHLTSTGDGREGGRRRQPMPQTLAWEDTAVSDDDDDEDDDATGYGYGHAPAEQVPYSNIQEIIPGLFIGDVTAAMDHALLKSKNITVIIAASGLARKEYNGTLLIMRALLLSVRQRYSAPEVGDLAICQGDYPC
jgi:hypothetical protein